MAQPIRTPEELKKLPTEQLIKEMNQLMAEIAARAISKPASDPKPPAQYQSEQ